MSVYGAKIPFGNLTMVCRLHSSRSFSFILAVTPSPKSVPSGSTIQALPLGFSICIKSSKNRSAVSLVR